jgi:hypothetical protein
MHGLHEQGSEVARLLAQIRNEYEAAHQGLSGLAQGSSQHQFITKRMERIGELHSQLHEILGDEAMALIARQLENEMPEAQAATQEHQALPKSRQKVVKPEAE